MNTRPQSRPEAELPELPEPQWYEIDGDSFSYYDADQLRAYGQQCAATRPSEVDPSMEPFCVDDTRATAGKGDRSND